MAGTSGCRFGVDVVWEGLGKGDGGGGDRGQGWLSRNRRKRWGRRS